MKEELDEERLKDKTMYNWKTGVNRKHYQIMIIYPAYRSAKLVKRGRRIDEGEVRGRQGEKKKHIGIRFKGIRDGERETHMLLWKQSHVFLSY